MKWFNNLRVKPKLITSFGIVILFVVALVLLSVYTVSNLDEGYTYLLEFPEKRLEYLSGLNSNCIDMRRTTATLAVNLETMDGAIDIYGAQFENAYNGAIDNIEKYIGNSNADKVRDPAVLKANNDTILDIKKQLESYKANIVDKALAVARSTGNQNATNEIFLGGASTITGVQAIAGELFEGAEAYVEQISAENTQSKKSAILLFIIISVLVVVLSVVIALLVAGMISKPLALLTAFMKKAGSTGDITLTKGDEEDILNYSNIRDEIGQCIGSTGGFIKRLHNVSKTLEAIADGDLATELSMLSDSDTIGLSLKKMSDGLNLMFTEINASSAQVSIGAGQVASGSQSLAQGSTEQAASVEELSASISEIADKTRQNAKMASEAACLSNDIKNNAENGSRQMEQLMQAVTEINDASQSISKVIKAIDDIAFQTNILALNAAVEAARAGQHGKGFAVVAEEVRNLAAKSAESAKDTSALLENSMEKSNLGLTIATETSASLKEIVGGINHSTEIVAQIALSSDEQANAVSLINTGIDQVSQVIQQNSATAEESAAASQEISGQASLLHELVGRFKLKKDDDTYKLPDLSAAITMQKRPAPYFNSKAEQNPPVLANAMCIAKY